MRGILSLLAGRFIGYYEGTEGLFFGVRVMNSPNTTLSPCPRLLLSLVLNSLTVKTKHGH